MLQEISERTSQESFTMNHETTDLEMLKTGNQKIAWASKHMPILNQIVEEYRPKQPLRHLVIVTSIHLESKTACLVKALADLGAIVYATGCNPLTTQDDVATALNNNPNVSVYAKYGCDESSYWDFLVEALSHQPHIIIDDGGDLVKLLHSKCAKYRSRLIGGCEETTTGISRLKAMQRKGKLRFMMYDVNDADCKHNYDNHYGTGQSVIDGILRTTNLIIAGKTAVVAGYGDCGSGIAQRLHGLGAKVIVTEINPIKALKANMDGFQVMRMDAAARRGDLFVTATGCKNVITKKHFNVMKNGALLANAGHFNVEIDANFLEKYANSHYEARKNIEAYTLKNGKTLYLLAEGRLVNLASADGHATEIMDMSFSIQLLGVIDIATNRDSTTSQRNLPGLYPIPSYIDEKVAKLALKAQGIRIDNLTKAQQKYLENGF